MNGEVCLTAIDVASASERMKAAEVTLKLLHEGQKRIEDSITKQNSDLLAFKSFARDDTARINIKWSERFDHQNTINEQRFSNIEMIQREALATFKGGTKTVSILWGIINSAIILGAIAYFWNFQRSIDQIDQKVITNLEQKYNIDIQPE